MSEFLEKLEQKIAKTKVPLTSRGRQSRIRAGPLGKGANIPIEVARISVINGDAVLSGSNWQDQRVMTGDVISIRLTHKEWDAVVKAHRERPD